MELLRQERSVTWFANKICCSRTNVYKIFERDNIDVRLLYSISRVLNHDFFADISEEL
ncbi:MAG: XRE family transcriptional regulator [Bacteroidales bacterium]|nr:XRE family transcriptional regulator [Bacteroidales bacterium]MBD5341833.1 XRE family transcriptional regulator [Bacteroides sp.]MBD5359584.1 XRE family transcriptional regulator [Bacteroides sp.]